MKSHELADKLLNMPDSELVLSLDGDTESSKALGFTKLFGDDLIEAIQLPNDVVILHFGQVIETQNNRSTFAE